MSGLAIALALFAAGLHATWNALLRSGSDRLWSVTIMSFATTFVAIPFAILRPFPPASAWPYLAASAVLQVAYSFFLVRAYRHGRLAQVYPIVRGSVPLLVILGAALTSHQSVTRNQLIGIASIVAGVMSLAIGQERPPTSALLYAVSTAALVAAYASLDAAGVRVSKDALGYAAWIFLTYGALMPLAFLAVRKRLAFNLRHGETQRALVGGVVSLLAYGAVIAAFSFSPAGPVTALRETSVVFAALIGRAVLHEPLTSKHMIACIAVAIGAAFVGWH